MTTRQQVIDEARTWLGTSYRHQANIKGLAVDCVNLVHEVYVATGAMDRRELPAYRTRPDGTLRGRIVEYLDEKPLTEVLPGDVLLFKGGPTGEDSHMAIVTAKDQIIHAFILRRAVVEHPMDARWWTWVTGCFTRKEIQ
jgi:NlpC/P60 family putative phage cell wall peptidase